MTMILTIIGIYIKLTGFLKASAFMIVFDIDKKILEKLVIIQNIYTELLFSKYISLYKSDYYKFEVVYTANYKNNIITIEKKDPKAKAKQLKNKNQLQKRMEKKRDNLPTSN